MRKEWIEEIQTYILDVLKKPVDNRILIDLYYKIGGYLSQKNLKTHELKILEWRLQEQFGIVIGFTKRNFISMIHFYNMYSSSELPLLIQMSWRQHLTLLKIKEKDKRNQMLKMHVLNNQNQKMIPVDSVLIEIRQLQEKILME